MIRFYTACAIIFSCVFTGFAEVPEVPWNVVQPRPAKYNIDPIYTDETLYLMPTYWQETTAGVKTVMDLSDVSTVDLRYRTSDMAAGIYYTVTGEVYSASGGVVRFLWTPSAVPTGSITTLDYAVVMTSTNGYKYTRGMGALRLRDGIAGSSTSCPLERATVDWAVIDNDNVDQAPFYIKAEVDALIRTDAEIEEVGVAAGFITNGVDTSTTGLVYYTLTTAVDGSNTVQDAATTAVQSNLTAHISDTTAAHVASAISATGTYANVQDVANATATALQPADTNGWVVTDTTYTAGTNLDLNGTAFSLDAAAQASDDLADSATQPADLSDYTLTTAVDATNAAQEILNAAAVPSTDSTYTATVSKASTATQPADLSDYTLTTAVDASNTVLSAATTLVQSNLTVHIDDATAAHAASAISTTGTYANVQDVANATATALQSEADTLATVTARGATTVNNITVSHASNDWELKATDPDQAILIGSSDDKGSALFISGAQYEGGIGGGQYLAVLGTNAIAQFRVMDNALADLFTVDQSGTATATGSITAGGGFYGDLVAGSVVATSVVPLLPNTYDLGTAAKPWRHVYVGTGSLYIGSTSLSESELVAVKASVDTFQGMPENLGVSTNYVWEPTRYFSYASPTNDFDFDMLLSTNSIHIGAGFGHFSYGAHATTWGTNVVALNEETPTGTNYFGFAYNPITKKWNVTIKAY